MQTKNPCPVPLLTWWTKTSSLLSSLWKTKEIKFKNQYNKVKFHSNYNRNNVLVIRQFYILTVEVFTYRIVEEIRLYNKSNVFFVVRNQLIVINCTFHRIPVDESVAILDVEPLDNATHLCGCNFNTTITKLW